MYASHGDMLGYAPLNLIKYPPVVGERHPYLESGKKPETKLIDKVGLFGTAGTSTWRTEFKKLYGASDDTFFNPQKGLGEWKPEDAKVEAENLARDRVLVFAITKDTEGYGSLAEVGFAMLGALLRGQKVGIYIEESDTFNADAQRARNLLSSILSRFHGLDDQVEVFDGLRSMAEWAKGAMAGTPKPVELPPVSRTLSPVVLLTGSSGSADGAPSIVRGQMKGLLGDTPFIDTYIPTDKFSRADAEREANLTQKAAVIVHTITSETESLGGLAEVAALAANAFANGQTLCVYLEPHESDRASNANKSRAIIRASMAELLKQYPGLVYFVEGKDGAITEDEEKRGVISREDALKQLADVSKGQIERFKS
jgi:hypothetical protein